jgi:hypothetical protein
VLQNGESRHQSPKPSSLSPSALAHGSALYTIASATTHPAQRQSAYSLHTSMYDGLSRDQQALKSASDLRTDTSCRFLLTSSCRFAGTSAPWTAGGTTRCAMWASDRPIHDKDGEGYPAKAVPSGEHDQFATPDRLLVARGHHRFGDQAHRSGTTWVGNLGDTAVPRDACKQRRSQGL